MCIKPIRAVAFVVTLTLISTVFVDTSSAQLFGRRGRGRAVCCPPVSTCCHTSGYGHNGYGHNGYGNHQNHHGYTNQSGQLLDGNMYNQGNADWQNSIQSSGQTRVYTNSDGSIQQGTLELQQSGTLRNSDGTFQTSPQLNSSGTSTREIPVEVKVQK